VLTLHSAPQAVGAPERDRAHDPVAQLLLHLERQSDFIHLQRIVDIRHLLAREFDIDDGADALDDGSLVHFRFLGFSIVTQLPRLGNLVSP
jgi:hypothetical protein